MPDLHPLLPQDDLNAITQKMKGLSSEYENSEVLVYGGTGFIGRWLVSALTQANLQYKMNIKIQVITRNVHSAKAKFGSVDSQQIDFIEHDFKNINIGRHLFADIIFQGAATTSKTLHKVNPVEIMNSMVNATLHATKVRSRNRTKPMIIHLSSGAVYGKQPIGVKRREEDSPHEIVSLSPYAEGKILSEKLLATAHLQGNIDYQSPRLFAFYGPLLPVNQHFAIGNFVENALSTGSILIEGNINTTRSYLYPTDLVNMLLQLPTFKHYSNINIGSDIPIKMIQLAEKISEIVTHCSIKTLDQDLEISNYVPETKFIKEKLNFEQSVSLDIGLDKWINWLRTKNNFQNN